MKTLVQLGSNISLYIFSDAAVVDIQSNQVVVTGDLNFIISDCNISNVVVCADVTPPSDWDGGKYFYTPSNLWLQNPAWVPPTIEGQNKQRAELLLQQTDWTCTVDISDPQYSNPHLGNQDAFLSYRSQVRAIAVNPPSTPAVFPEKPNEVWVSV